MTQTRFRRLAYEKIQDGCWMFFFDGAQAGQQYATRTELLADVEPMARVVGLIAAPSAPNLAADLATVKERLAEAIKVLKLECEHTDDLGKQFYCNCARYGRIVRDSRYDPDEKHSTSCVATRSFLAKVTK